MSTDERLRVVFDCNIFLQALIKPKGPSGECVASAFRGDLDLFVSDYVLGEVREVAGRPAIAARFGVTEEKTVLLLSNVAKVATTIVDVPTRYEHPYDPDDSHYVN